MTVDISFNVSKLAVDDAYIINSPYMQVNLNGGFGKGKVNGRTLKIFKELAEDHHYFREKKPTCDTTFSIVLLTPGNECTQFEEDFDRILRPQTCDKAQCIPGNNGNHIRVSIVGAHQVLDVIVRLSTEFFGSLSNLWLDKARQFIENGPVATKENIASGDISEFETKISKIFSEQEGALNLLADLKQKPFSSSIQTILKRLLNGVYGDLSGDTPNASLMKDLEIRDLKDLVPLVEKGRYDHLGPNFSENKNKLLDAFKSAL